MFALRASLSEVRGANYSVSFSNECEDAFPQCESVHIEKNKPIRVNLFHEFLRGQGIAQRVQSSLVNYFCMCIWIY